MSGSPPRRSQRTRVATKRYSDAFQASGLETDQFSGEDNSPPPERRKARDDDADFNVAEAEDEEGVAEEEDARLSLSNDDDQDPIKRGKHARRERSKRIEKHAGRDRLKGKSKPRYVPDPLLPALVSVSTMNAASKQENRATKDHVTSLSDRSLYIVGPGVKDASAWAQVRARWMSHTAFPSSFRGLPSSTAIGVSPFCPPEQLDAFNKGWQWYFPSTNVFCDESHGVNLPMRHQASVILSPAAAKQYDVSDLDQNVRRVIHGSFRHQRISDIRAFECLDLDQKEDQDGGAATDGLSKQPTWLLNLGCKVSCIAWVPFNSSSQQYLSISTMKECSETSSDQFKQTSAPAFSPSAPEASALQIWAIAGQGQSSAGSFDLKPRDPPKRHLSVCMDWGEIEAFEWCPVPAPQEQIDAVQSGHKPHLLTAVFGDGYARVLDIPIENERAPASKQRYIHIKSAVFEFRPPNTICTCAAWISTQNIAVGCANGYVTIIDLKEAMKQRTGSNSRDYVPFFFFPLHNTFVLNVTSGWPSRPHLLFTNSVSGYARITDLRDATASLSIHPDINSSNSTRTRFGLTAMVWQELSQHCLAVDETMATLRAMSTRRFYGTSTVMTLPSTVGGRDAIAVSLWHPFALVGTLDGTLVHTNAICKLMVHKSNVPSNRIFTHEWSSATDEARACPGGGIVRMISGYGTENLRTSRTEQGKSRPRRKRGALQVPSREDGGATLATVFEERSAVTAAAWNPNACCRGWIASGMASGLVRIENLARG